jgi:hypothetical protein
MRPMSFFHHLKLVLWSFIGLGRRKHMDDPGQRINPLVLILIAFVLVLLFLGTLAFIARSVVAGG